MKRILASAAVLLAVGAFVVIAGGASNGTPAGTYKVELDNAFGLVGGSDFKVAGVKAGTIQHIALCYTDPNAHCQNPLHALVTIQVTQKGFGQFRTDSFCQSRPQSLIGEYFIECQPGQNGKVIKPGGTIPVTNTQSTIPADLLADVMRMPYRERFTLIINELGAAVAGRSDDLRAALRRAVPALTQTDNLLNLLANDSHTLQQLTVNSDQVITALANNSSKVQRFIVEANNAATDTAAQEANFRSTWHQLPGFLEQLRPAMAKLDAAVTANQPVVANLNAASGQLKRLFVNLVPFSHASLPALRSLGQAGVTGKVALTAAKPTIKDLNQFARHTPELAQNLAIVGHDLDDRSRAVEADSRSPSGKGYTGLEALLQYVFNQTLAINSFSQFGHLLAVDAFIDPACSPYANPQRIANSLASMGPSYRHCYAFLGPNQPGVNETDPTNPRACVPDPGGAPPGEPGPQTTACKLSPQPTASLPVPTTGGASDRPSASATSTRSQSNSPAAGGGGPPSPAAKRAQTLQQTVGQVLSGVAGGSSPSASGNAPSSSGSSSQAQQLLNYLLAP